MKEYKPRSLEGLLNDEDAIQQMLVQDLIPMGEPVFIYGNAGELKSAVVLNLCLNIQAGKSISDKATKKEKILWIALEGDKDISARVIAHTKEYGSDEEYNIWFEDKLTFTFGNKEDETALSKVVKHNQIRVVVLDCLTFSADGDISTGNTSGIVTKQMRRMCNELNITFIVIAHTGKDSRKGIKGASEFYNNVPCVIYIYNGALKVTKQRSRESGTTLHFKRIIHDTGKVDQFGDPIKAVCIEWVNEQMNPRHQAIKESYKKLLEEKEEVSRKDLFHAVLERNPGRNKKSVETQFNRDLKLMKETSKIGNVSNSSYKGNNE